MTEKLTLERAEVASIESSTLSLMPEGLLDSLKPEQARDLIGYLMHQTQVPLPSAAGDLIGPVPNQKSELRNTKQIRTGQ